MGVPTARRTRVRARHNKRGCLPEARSSLPQDEVPRSGGGAPGAVRWFNGARYAQDSDLGRDRVRGGVDLHNCFPPAEAISASS